MSTHGTINSTVFDRKIGMCGYVSTPAVTTVTNAGDWYAMLGTFTNAHIEQVSVIGTPSNPAIQYDGDVTMDFEIDWSGAFIGSAGSQHIEFAIKKGANVITGSNMGTTEKTAGDEYSMSGTCVVSLATNDTIQLVVTSAGNGQTVQAEHFTTTIRPFFY